MRMPQLSDCSHGILSHGAQKTQDKSAAAAKLKPTLAGQQALTGGYGTTPEVQGWPTHSEHGGGVG
ncbi:hypothetical protein B0T18DRAFT_408839, partial [Schizothecium vesticola]